MTRWAEFEAAMPEMAAEGWKLLYQFGLGLGFLATVRADGGPRLHPMCPILWARYGPRPSWPPVYTRWAQGS